MVCPKMNSRTSSPLRGVLGVASTGARPTIPVRGWHERAHGRMRRPCQRRGRAQPRQPRRTDDGARPPRVSANIERPLFRAAACPADTSTQSPGSGSGASSGEPGSQDAVLVGAHAIASVCGELRTKVLVCLGKSRGDRSFGDPKNLADLGVRRVSSAGRWRPVAAAEAPRTAAASAGSPLVSTNATSGTSSTSSSRDPVDPIATRNAIRHTPALERPLAAECVPIAQRLGERLLNDVTRALDTPRDRREHHLERAVTPAVQVLEVGFEAIHGHKGATAPKSFSETL